MSKYEFLNKNYENLTIGGNSYKSITYKEEDILLTWLMCQGGTRRAAKALKLSTSRVLKVLAKCESKLALSGITNV